MNNGMASHEGTQIRRKEMVSREGAKARRVENSRHTRESGYPGSWHGNSQQPLEPISLKAVPRVFAPSRLRVSEILEQYFDTAFAASAFA